jgi:hypothetical protein
MHNISCHLDLWGEGNSPLPDAIPFFIYKTFLAFTGINICITILSNKSNACSGRPCAENILINALYAITSDAMLCMRISFHLNHALFATLDLIEGWMFVLEMSL